MGMHDVDRDVLAWLRSAGALISFRDRGLRDKAEKLNHRLQNVQYSTVQ
jgi:hypothetical protein